MKASEINYTAVRALLRVWEPVATAHDISAAADAKFDGGEWSDAQNAKGLCYAFEKTCEYVAPRFNIEPQQLAEMVQTAEYVQYDYLRMHIS